MTNAKTSKPAPQPGYHEASGGDRGEAGSQNAKQSQAIGQDDPLQGSGIGRESDKASGYPGTPDIGTNAGQKKNAPEDPKEGQRRDDRR